MKTIKLTFFLLLFTFIFTGCNTNDDDFYNTEYIAIPNLVQVQTQFSYSAGDFLYVNAYINRLQTEANQSTLLDLRKSTGNADSFTFSYLIEKQVNATDWVLVDAGPANRILVSGAFETGSFYNATAIFNSITDKYEYRAGIKLPSAGQYRLSFGYNSSSTNSVELRSDSIGNNLAISINSIAPILSSDGYYSFTVL